MSAIDFVARTSAGEYQRGVVGDNGASSVMVGHGTDLSINLYPGQVAGYERHGQALVLVLVNGERITVENYFDAAGEPAATLYVSAGGELFEVELAGGEGGTLYPNYAGTGSFGKYNPDDAFFFLRGPELLVDAPADGGSFPILPVVGALAGAAALAALLGNGSDKDITDVGGETATSEPFILIGSGVVSSGDVTDATEVENGVAIGGTGTPGGTVVVTVGEATAETVVNEDGTWQVTFEPGEIEGGEYTTPVVAVITNEDGTDEDEDQLEVDTLTFVTIDQDSIGGDGVVNDAERDGGTPVRGTTEANATVVVTIGETSLTTTADDEGNWQVTFPVGSFDEGTFEQGVSAVATDAYGNSAEATGAFMVDTETFVTIDTSNVEGDGVVNRAERLDGVTLTGTAEAGATVILTAKGTEYTTTADATTGAWSVDVARGDILTGEQLQTVSVKATDVAGNSAETDGDITIDTTTFVTVNDDTIAGDGVINRAERLDGVTLTGTAEAGAEVSLFIAGTTLTTVADGDGNWSVDLDRTLLSTGQTTQPISVTATDIAGNTASTDGALVIDTIVNPLTGVDPVTGDDVLNSVEATTGVTLEGTVEAGSTVVVTFEGTTRPATVTGTDWSVDFTPGEIPHGDYVADVSITATDPAGNVRTITDTFQVDTVVPEVPRVSSFEKGIQGFRSIGVSDTDEGLAVTALRPGGRSVEQEVDAVVDTRFDEVDLYFATTVPDGTQLVISSTDDAGNQNATLLVLDEAGTDLVNIGHRGLSNFDVGSIDLNFALDSELTITAADLEGLSRNDNTLVVHGGTDDTVTLTGATAAGTQAIDGRNYDIYALGDEGGKVILDPDITVIT